MKKIALKKLVYCLTFIWFYSPFFAYADWQDTVKVAKNQVVYFNAWGGSDTTNDYIQWAINEVKTKYDITVKHVKISDTALAVSRILAEKTSGKNSNGSVDLVWINGENFKNMKTNKLLLEPWTQKLPNYKLLDSHNKALQFDFTIPVNNQEAPWGKAQLVFMYDSSKIKTPSASMQDFLKIAKNNPQRLSYPAPPNFHGTTFIKQVLYETVQDKSKLTKSVNPVEFESISAPLWLFLDELHPYLWKKGKQFTKNVAKMKQMLNDGELFASLSFNPNEASNAIANNELPDTIKINIHKNGTIGNVHFLAIPFNSSSSAGAQVFVNFLMSPVAQSRKANIDIWGDPTILAINKLSIKQKQLFDNLPKGKASLSATELSNLLPEPHPSWVNAVEKKWLELYSK